MSFVAPHTQRLNYNPVGIAYNSSKIKGFSPSHVRAGTCALLRYQSFSDGTDDTYHTSTNGVGGMHPLYFIFNNPDGSTGDPERRQLLQDTLMDIFDAVSETS